MKKPRPSTLPHLERCPRYVSRPDKAENEIKDDMDMAAEEGTFLHAVMEELAGSHTQDNWDDYIQTLNLSPAQAPLIQDAADQVRDLFQLGLPVYSKNTLDLLPDDHYMLDRCTVLPNPDGSGHMLEYDRVPDGVYIEVSVDPGVTRPGTADLVAIMGTGAVLVDYKFTMVERDHDAQMSAYVLGLFNAVPGLQVIENRIVAPRLRDAHRPHIYTRKDDYDRLYSELSGILSRAEDPFTPGCPGAPCAVCLGNGRCPWQMASLRDIPVEETGVILADAWRPILAAREPDTRAQRRRLYSWLGKMLEAIKEDDKNWAEENPHAELPGFKKTLRLGRLSLDKDRSPEICNAFMEEFSCTMDSLLEVMDVNLPRATEFVALHCGLSQDAAKKRVREMLSPYMTRGRDVIYFTEVKDKKSKTKKALTA